MEVFLQVKQDAVLYEACMGAAAARQNGEYTTCFDRTKAAFVRMAENLTKSEGVESEQLVKALSEMGILTDRSLAAYREVLMDRTEVDELIGENTYASLEEEIDKYAKYYQKGISPKTIEELTSGFRDGVHSTRGQRTDRDNIFSTLLPVGLIVIGLILLLLSLTPSMSNWFVGGIVFATAGVLFLVMKTKIKK